MPVAVLGFIGAAVSTVGSFVVGLSGLAAAIPGVGGLLSAGLGAIGYGIVGSGAAIAAGGWAGAAALTKAVLTTASIASMFVSTPAIGQAGSTLDFKADPNAGIPYLVGRCGTGGSMIAQRTSNDAKGEYLHNFVVLSGAGPVDEIQTFSVDNTIVSFTSGAATTSPYTGKMFSSRTLGPISSWSLSQPSGTGTVAEWTSAHKASSYAMDRWVLKGDPEVYSGMPEPQWVGKWVKVYDPRYDSTYPGGSGSQRWADPRTDPAGYLSAQATWAWSENPLIHALNWRLGRWARNEADSGSAYVLTHGLGAPITAIDVAAFVAGANVSDANDWTIGGGVTSRDSKAEVDRAMLQAGGAVPLRVNARMSCLVSMPRTSVATLTDADFAGDISFAGAQPARDKPNQIQPRYLSEDHGWKYVDAAAVAVPDYITAAGRLRPRGIGWPMVTDVDQVTQLALYSIFNAHEFGPVVLPLMPRWMGLEVGEVITLVTEAFPGGQEFLIQSKTTDLMTGLDSLVCVSETSAKHALALAATGEAPPVPGITGFDPHNIPAPGSFAWSATGSTVTEGTVSLPVIDIAGAVDNAAAEAVIFEIRREGESDSAWRSLGEHPRVTTKLRETGLLPGAPYEVAVRYKVNGAVGARRVLPVATSGIFTPGEPSTGGGGTGGSGGSLADGAVLFDSSAAGDGEFLVPSDGYLDLELWGAGGTPGGYPFPESDDYYEGGGSGAYVKKHVAVTASDVLAYHIGGSKESGQNGGSTTITALSLSAGGGTGGEFGPGGTASGGDTNTDGNDGTTSYGAGAPLGGGDVSAAYADGSYPGGGGYQGGLGAPGRLLITYRTS